jgi:hypothetical protein
MSVQMRITQQIVVNDVSQFNEVTNLEAEGNDVFNVEIGAGESDVEISLVTGVIGDIGVVAIRADEYEESAVPVLSYKVHDSGNDPVVLDKPVLINGSGAAALLIDPLDKIFFSNTGLVAKVVTIIIGRHVTP